MSKIIIGLIAIFLMFFYGINTLRKMPANEKISLTMTVVYSIVCSLLTVAVMAAIIVLF